jgi:leader peptidase (prepilin peptidase) / N-methyltransferase
MPLWFNILGLFAVGACIGSFLNVVVYRLPRGMSLISPPSRCPKCETPLAWYDNIPVLGWIFLRGRCRYCRNRISARYPIIEAITGGLFVFYYFMFFIKWLGPPEPMDWPIFALYMALVAGLLAASLIDAELFIIPAGIPWWLAAAGVIVHAGVDQTNSAGSLIEPPFALALSAGSLIGLAVSIFLLHAGVLPLSFPDGALLEVERAELEKEAGQARETGGDAPEIPPELTSSQVRTEIRKEMLFLMPPLVLGGLSVVLHEHVPAVRSLWYSASHINWLNAGLGSILGGLVGAFVVWITRILGSYALGKEAMGLGDVHLMLGVGAVLGAGMATVIFFLAPFAGLVAGLYLWLTRSRRQLPYGPYLSLAAGFVMLFYTPIADYLQPGTSFLLTLIRQSLP